MYERKELFDLIVNSVSETAVQHEQRLDQAFGQWFANLYFENPQGLYLSDGSRDGKVDLFFRAETSGLKQHVVVNTKFTKTYNEPAPRLFYDEVTRFWEAFANK